MVVNDVDKLVNERRARQHEACHEADRQIKILRLETRDTRCQQLLQQAELTVATVNTCTSNYHGDSSAMFHHQTSSSGWVRHTPGSVSHPKNLWRESKPDVQAGRIPITQSKHWRQHTRQRATITVHNGNRKQCYLVYIYVYWLMTESRRNVTGVTGVETCFMNWLTELWFYVPLDTKQVILETFPKPTSWLGIEKLNLTQQKHAFTNQKKGTATQNKHKTKTRFSRLLQHPAWK